MDYELSFIATIKLWLRRTLVLLQFFSVFSDCFGLPQQAKYFLILIASLAITKNLRCGSQSPITWSVRHCEAVFKMLFLFK